jgi:hypothetical protein
MLFLLHRCKAFHGSFQAACPSPADPSLSLAYAPDYLQQLSSQDDPADLLPAWPATAAPLAGQTEPLQHFEGLVNSGCSQAAGHQLQDVVPVGSIPDVQLSFSADLGAGLQGEFPLDQQVINVAASSRSLQICIQDLLNLGLSGTPPFVIHDELYSGLIDTSSSCVAAASTELRTGRGRDLGG